MKVVPQAFFQNPQAFPHLYYNHHSCILYKSLDTPSLQHEHFVSTHVLTLVLKGIKILHPYDGKPVTVSVNQMVLIPKNL